MGRQGQREWGRIWSFLSTRSRERERLEAFLLEYEHYFALRPRREDDWWARVGEELLKDAKSAVRNGEIEVAWVTAQSAARMAVFGYDKDELASARIALRHEAEQKLDSWRRVTVMELLSNGTDLAQLVEHLVGDKAMAAKVVSLLAAGSRTDTKESVAGVLRGHRQDYSDGVATLLTEMVGDKYSRRDEGWQRQALFHATLIRDEHSANVYRQLAALRRQLVALSLVLVALLAGIMTIAILDPVNLNGRPTGSWTWVWVSLFGALGGCFSALLSTSRRSPRSRLPEQLQQWLVTAARPLIGSAAALLAYALFEAEIVRVGPANNVASLLIVAFAAGFSERLVGAALEGITARGEERVSAPPPSTP